MLSKSALRETKKQDLIKINSFLLKLLCSSLFCRILVECAPEAPKADDDDENPFVDAAAPEQPEEEPEPERPDLGRQQSSMSKLFSAAKRIVESSSDDDEAPQSPHDLD